VGIWLSIDVEFHLVQRSLYKRRIFGLCLF